MNTRTSASSGSRRCSPARPTPTSTTCRFAQDRRSPTPSIRRTRGQGAFDKLSDGKDLAFVPVGHKDYLEFIELNKYLEELRRKKS